MSHMADHGCNGASIFLPDIHEVKHTTQQQEFGYNRTLIQYLTRIPTDLHTD